VGAYITAHYFFFFIRTSLSTHDEQLPQTMNCFQLLLHSLLSFLKKVNSNLHESAGLLLLLKRSKQEHLAVGGKKNEKWTRTPGGDWDGHMLLLTRCHNPTPSQ
jgi:hypothetical protein